MPPFDGATIAAAVRVLAGDADRREAMGLAAQVAVEQRTWAAVGDELITHYRAVATPSMVAA